MSILGPFALAFVAGLISFSSPCCLPLMPGYVSATIGVLRVPILYRERRFDLARIRPGPVGALPLGMAFAIGWTPCIGPVLGAILTAAATFEDAYRGAALLLVYSLGLGVPFLLLAFALAKTGRVFGWFRRHARAIELVGGGVLVLMGVLMFTGQWVQLFAPLLRVYSRSGWPPV